MLSIQVWKDTRLCLSFWLRSFLPAAGTLQAQPESRCALCLRSAGHLWDPLGRQRDSGSIALKAKKERDPEFCQGSFLNLPALSPLPSSLVLQVPTLGTDYISLLTVPSMLGVILVRVTSAMIKHQDQQQLGEKRVSFTHSSMKQFIPESMRAGTQAGQERGGRS